MIVWTSEPQRSEGVFLRGVFMSRGDSRKRDSLELLTAELAWYSLLFMCGKNLLVASDARVTHGAIGRLALKGNLKPGADDGIAVFPD